VSCPVAIVCIQGKRVFSGK